MAARGERIYTLNPVGASTVWGPVELTECGGATFTLQVTTTGAGALTASTLTVRGSNIGRANASSPLAPVLAGVSSVSSPVGGLSDPVAGVITLSIASVGTFERTYSLAGFPQLVWFDLAYGSGGGTPSFSIAVGAWSV